MTTDDDVVEVHRVEELMGRDLLLETITRGDGEMAEVSVIVTCNYKGYFYSCSDQRRLSDEPFEVCNGQSFQIGEGDAVPGLELALRRSHVGDVFRVYIASKFAYGYLGRCCNADGSNPTNGKIASIPPNTDIEYEVEVTHHLRDGELDTSISLKCSEELSKTSDESERNLIRGRYHTLQSMLQRKEAGNRWFSYLDYPRAAKAYSRATQVAEGFFNPDKQKKQKLNETVEETAQRLQKKEDSQSERPVTEEDKDLIDAYLACLNNLAACKLSTKEYLAAKDICVQVLQLSPYNGKALLRAAKATLALGSYDECEACLKKLLVISENDEALKAATKIEYAKLRKTQADYKAQNKEIQKRMASKLFNAQQKSLQPQESQQELQGDGVKPTGASLKSFEDSTTADSPEEVTKEVEPKEPQTTSPPKVLETPPIPSKSKATSQSNAKHSNEKDDKLQSQAEQQQQPAKTPSTDNSVLILVGTSLAIVLVSLVVAYMNQN